MDELCFIVPPFSLSGDSFLARLDHSLLSEQSINMSLYFELRRPRPNGGCRASDDDNDILNCSRVSGVADLSPTESVTAVLIAGPSPWLRLCLVARFG